MCLVVVVAKECYILSAKESIKMNNPYALGDPVPSCVRELEAYKQYCGDVTAAYMDVFEPEGFGDAVRIASISEFLTFIHQYGYPYVWGNQRIWCLFLHKFSEWDTLQFLPPQLCDIIAEVKTNIEY